jgi:thiol-disulfide isomerase/thioredoxin
MTTVFRFLLILVLGLQIGVAKTSLAADEIIVTVSDDVEISITRYPAQGKYLLLWLAPEYGFRKAHRSLAERLPEQNIEAWQTDIVEALFLPQGSSSLKQLDGKYVADLIEYAHELSGKKIVVAGDSYAAMSALLGARHWQSRNQADPYLLGAILFSPYSYAYIPPLGLPPEYMPIVESTNIPLVIYQAQNSGIVGQFDELLAKLRTNDSPIYTRMAPDVMSLFYEEEPTPAMNSSAQPIPASIRQLLPVLARHGIPVTPVPMKQTLTTKSGIDIYLKDFHGNSEPVAFTLTDINGNSIVKSDFTGKVTVVNFWASWCPPCVEEIPSLNRLQEKMEGRPFELISINYAEDKKTVSSFMQRVNVDFPVLLDHDGATAHRWKVITYPSTFVIDRQGKFRYGVNAAIEWDAPELIQKLESLMQ